MDPDPAIFVSGSVPKCHGSPTQLVRGEEVPYMYAFKFLTQNISVADPDQGSGIRCLIDPWILDPGWVESQHPDPG